MQLRNVLFPDPPRTFPGRRAAKISCRAIHVLCAGVLVGSHVLAVDPSLQRTWLSMTIATGLALLLLDLHESAAFLAQVRGVVVLGKLGVVAALPWLGSAQTWCLVALLLLSVLLSHAPSRVRYFVVLGRGTVRGAFSKG